MSKKYWIITRPKRKLIIVPELLKVFAVVAVGNKWSGNRELQKEFERKLVDFEWKAQNLSRDGSGSRTYAALLGMLGLWYEEENEVKLTQAAKEVISGEPAVPLLTKQLINYQYPSPYSQTVKIDGAFRIQPHRFIINLLFESRIDHLSEKEIAYCVVPFAKTERDLESCIERILSYRLLPTEIIANALEVSGTSQDNLENIANTVINQLEYTGFFKYRDEINAPFMFDIGGKDKAREFIGKYGRGIISSAEDKITYQKRYGSGINTTKDYSTTNPVQPNTNPEDRLVLITFYEIAQTKPIFGITDELVSEVSQRTGINPQRVRSVLSKIANQPLLDSFEEKYIILSKGGTETATDFEKVTTNIFSSDGFGIDAEWVGSMGVYPDIFVYIDKISKKHGIVDTKAYKEYKLNIDQRNKMAHSYIPKFSKLKYKGDNYALEFFAYVAGGFGSNIQSSFENLLSECGGINGSYVTSYNFMQLLRKHKAGKFTTDQFRRLFTQNKEIIYDELAT